MLYKPLIYNSKEFPEYKLSGYKEQKKGEVIERHQNIMTPNSQIILRLDDKIYTKGFNQIRKYYRCLIDNTIVYFLEHSLKEI